MREVTPQKGVIKVGNRYLILRRSAKEETFPGLWDFPGGKLEPGEDPFIGVEREVMEETGMVIKAKMVVFRFDFQLNDMLVHYVLYDADVVKGDPEHITISDEHSDYKLATAEEIRNLPVSPYMIPYLDSIL